MSDTFSPARCSRRGTAKTGPMPISSGSQPATAKPRKMPSGWMPSCSARLPFITTQALAPSELAGVAGGDHAARQRRARPLTASSVVSPRMPSSLSMVTSLRVMRPVALSTTPITVVIGTISAANLPASCAAWARCWLRTPYSSCASLLIL
jgi:hypothetical protein